MIKTLLKGFAIAFGGGVALGAGLKLAQSSRRPKPLPALDLSPLLDRLDKVEECVGQMESRVESGSEQRGAELVADLSGRMSELERQLPQVVESQVNVRMREMEAQLQENLLQAQMRATEDFMQAIQTRVVQRISILESSLAEQSEAIALLQNASARTDENLQKLIAGVERLCEQNTKTAAPAGGLEDVSTAIREMEARLTKDFLENQQGAIDGLVKSLQSALGQRITDLEIKVTEHSATAPVRDLEARLPGIIDAQMEDRMKQMQTALEQNFRQAQVRAMEAFFGAIQGQVTDRISRIETGLREQSENSKRLQAAWSRTEDELQRLVDNPDGPWDSRASPLKVRVRTAGHPT